MSRKVAVILAGCGVFDGSEIHEAVTTLLSLDRAEVKAVCFAPQGPHHHIIDHITGYATGETRDILTESARISRGEILPLADLDMNDFDAVIIPGGFGVAKNLCSFAQDGPNCTVSKELEPVLWAAYREGKPIGALCIAPAVVARVLGSEGITVTVGNTPEVAKGIEAMGAAHEEKPADGVCVDSDNRVVTSPGYMRARRISEVADGAEAVVREMLALCEI